MFYFNIKCSILNWIMTRCWRSNPNVLKKFTWFLKVIFGQIWSQVLPKWLRIAHNFHYFFLFLITFDTIFWSEKNNKDTKLSHLWFRMVIWWSNSLLSLPWPQFYLQTSNPALISSGRKVVNEITFPQGQRGSNMAHILLHILVFYDYTPRLHFFKIHLFNVVRTELNSSRCLAKLLHFHNVYVDFQFTCI